MSKNIRDDLQNSYICGQCKTEIFYDKGDSAPDCEECGWKHKELKKSQVPSTIKLDLRKY